MMTGTGQVGVGESAASKKLRMISAADKKLVSPPPPEDAYKPFPVRLEKPPLPPQPVMDMPQRPDRLAGWEQKSWGSRLAHHVGLYNHKKAERKEKLARDSAAYHTKRMNLRKQDEVRFAEEQKVYEIALDKYLNQTATPPPPPKPTLAEMSDFDIKRLELQGHLKALEKQRIVQDSLVVDIQESCQNNYNEAKRLILVPGREAQASLRAKDYQASTNELARAKHRYNKIVDTAQRIANTLELAMDTERDRLISLGLTVVADQVSEHIDEVREAQDELKRLKVRVPEASEPDGPEGNAALEALLQRLQDEALAETHRKLIPDEMPGHLQNNNRIKEPALAN